MVEYNVTLATPSKHAWLLNPSDPGLLGVLALLSATDASQRGPTGSSVANHVDHLRYGFELLNRWNAGEEPFATADYSASWKRTTVSDAEWTSLQDQLRDGVDRWKAAVSQLRPVDATELSGVVASVAHLAYHLGAIRQLQPLLRGPRASDWTSPRTITENQAHAKLVRSSGCNDQRLEGADEGCARRAP